MAMQRQGGQPERALEVFMAMRTNVITCNALISACEKGEELERALEVLEAMQQQDVAPSLITYSALISACKRGK